MRPVLLLPAVLLAASVLGCGGGGSTISGARSTNGPTATSPSGQPSLGGVSTTAPKVTPDAVSASGTVTNANLAAGTLTLGMLTGVQGFIWNGEPVVVVTNGSTRFSAQDGTQFRADAFFGFASNATVSVAGFANNNGTMTASMVEYLSNGTP
ncbi:MAG: hypothetical protein KGJ62_03465 [Armatimonadetes bacterium]|nr:hypothetical protein [Armatimonadota bacterium]MDE2205707.1 hypothetical protein [Armatimonadota bacterium]